MAIPCCTLSSVIVFSQLLMFNIFLMHAHVFLEVNQLRGRQDRKRYLGNLQQKKDRFLHLFIYLFIVGALTNFINLFSTSIKYHLTKEEGKMMSFLPLFCSFIVPPISNKLVYGSLAFGDKVMPFLA